MADIELPAIGSKNWAEPLVNALDAVNNEQETGRLSETALSTTIGAAVASSTISVGERMRRAAAAAATKNRSVMATPPTIADGTAILDASLTKSYRVGSGTNLSLYRIVGGIGQIGAGAYSAYAMAPVVSNPGGTGGNTSGDVAHTSWCRAYEFVTDAPVVQIRCLGASGGIGYQIEVDGQPVGASQRAYAAQSSTTNYILLTFPDARPRTIRFEQSKAGALDGVYVGPTYTIWRPKSSTDVRVVTVGDSIDTGQGAGMPNGSWQVTAAKMLGWTDVRQVSFGGTGFTNAGTYNTFGDALRVADTVASHPEALVISASQNDDGSASIQSAALATFRAYRTACPGIPIVCVGVDSGSSGPSVTRYATEDAVKAAFDQWADPNSFWIPVARDASGPWETGTGLASATNGTGNRDRYGSDTSHPNQAGHDYIAQRWADAFKALVLPSIP